MSSSSQRSFHSDTPDSAFRYDPFWFNDHTVLYKYERLQEFFPSLKLSFAENLNALVRLSVYTSILLYLFGNTYTVFYFPLVVTALTYMVWNYKKDVVQMDEGMSEGVSSQKVQKPSIANPFMNVLLTDYTDNPTRGKASNLDNEARDENFRFNLYREIGDVYENNHSERQFYTMPNTLIPNNREDFANWLYKTDKTLKERTLEN